MNALRGPLVGTVALLAALLAALLSFTRPGATAAIAQTDEIRYRPRYTAGPCRLELPRGEFASATVNCGILRVPEDRATGRGVVQLAVVRLRARSKNPAPDPILYLAGGPGGNASGRIDEWHDSPLRDDRDIILLDQRGTGYSLPSLDCEGAYGRNVESWGAPLPAHPTPPRRQPRSLHQPR